MTEIRYRYGYEPTAETMRRAQKVKDYLEADPRRHAQNYWFTSLDADNEPTGVVDWKKVKAIVDSEGELNICGTAMCLAGTVKFHEQGIKGLRAFDRDVNTAYKDAGRLLGMGPGLAYQVFYQTANEPAMKMLSNLAAGRHPFYNVEYWHEKIQENARIDGTV